jgi:regulator of replication initiation timing
LRNTYERLHADDYINNKTVILVRVDKKLITENKILRIENEGLRGIIFEKKRKKKRDKFLNFYKENE